MRFCHQCQALLEDGRGFCPKCFAPVKSRGWFGRLIDSLFHRSMATPTRTTQAQTTIRKKDRTLLRRVTAGDIPADLPPEVREAAQSAIDAVANHAESVALPAERMVAFHELPEEVRQKLRELGVDASNFKATVTRGETKVFKSTSSTTFGRGGRVERSYSYTGPDGVKRSFSRLEDMPPEIRAHFERETGP